jgi:hypothetical protein
MAQGMLCDISVFVVSLCLFYRHVLRHSLFCSLFLLVVLRFKLFDERFVVCNILTKLLNYVILFVCVAKANYWGEDKAYCPRHIISHHTPRHVSEGQLLQRLVFEHGPFHLTFVTIHNWHFEWFSPVTFHSPVSILTLMLHTHTMTTVDAT